MHEQLNIFAASYEKPELPKHIRLIEFFAGIGAQAKALEILGADFEHWRTCEWSWQSITAYNAIHMNGLTPGTSHLTYDEVLDRLDGISNDSCQPMSREQIKRRGEEWARTILGKMIANHNFCPDVSRLHGKDLKIVDKANNTYLLTYSFPCQDLSLAGTQKGYERGSGTRSGLLWEVERILLECQELDALPQVLIMENVPQVIGKNSIQPFNEWLAALEKMGYANYYKLLNGKDYGIPQNRNRCFMVSILGNYSFHFPRKMKLRYCLNDFKEKKVDEYYYLSDELVASFVAHTEKQISKGNGFRFSPTDGEGIAHTITTREGSRTDDNYIYSQREDEGAFTPLELHIPSATKKGYMEATEGDGILPSWKGARGVVQKGMIPTIMTNPDTIGVVVNEECDDSGKPE